MLAIALTALIAPVTFSGLCAVYVWSDNPQRRTRVLKLLRLLLRR